MVAKCGIEGGEALRPSWKSKENLRLEKGALDNSGAAQFQNLHNVKGSLKLLSNRVLDFRTNVMIFQNLVHVCSGGRGGATYDDGMACGMIIRK